MTSDQQYLLIKIGYQQHIISQFPDDLVEQVTLDTMYEALRSTFSIVSSQV